MEHFLIRINQRIGIDPVHGKIAFMKKISKGIIFLVSLFFVFSFSSAFSQEDMVEIDNSVFKNPVRPPARFKHDEHNERAQLEDCNECHHVYENGKLLADESSEDKRCAECHRQGKDDGKPNLMKAYHLNCKQCHLKRKKGPITCAECHMK